jgi:hypothetical protein
LDSRGYGFVLLVGYSFDEKETNQVIVRLNAEPFRNHEIETSLSISLPHFTAISCCSRFSWSCQPFL